MKRICKATIFDYQADYDVTAAIYTGMTNAHLKALYFEWSFYRLVCNSKMVELGGDESVLDQFQWDWNWNEVITPHIVENPGPGVYSVRWGSSTPLESHKCRILGLIKLKPGTSKLPGQEPLLLIDT